MFAIEIPCCDLNLLYQGNQSYRWIKVNENKYIIINGNHIVLAQQRKNKKAFLCSEEDFYNIWYDYFDVNYDYYENLFEVKRFAKKSKSNCCLIPIILKQNIKMRLLKSDIFETMIYYLLDDDYNYRTEIEYKERRKNPKEEKIKEICQMFGKKRHNSLDGIQITWYEFPGIYDINNDIARSSILTQDEVKRIKHLIYNLRQQNEIWDDLKTFNDYDTIYNILKEVYNDPNWIKNVMLYSLGFKDAFPIRERNKRTFDTMNLKPIDFKEFDNIKGLLLEYFKVNENMSVIKGK